MNTTLNQLNIFIVLGIAADDIFVFCDAWRQSLLIKAIADNEHRRMAYTFKRSFKAIAVTSSTTAVAFLANTFSDIRPIRSFGIYAAIIIPVNFFIVILVMPSIQILHDRYFKDSCIKFKEKICAKPSDNAMHNAQVEPEKGMSDSGGTLKHYKFQIEDESTIDINNTVENEKPPEMTFLNRFFSGPYNRFIFKLRYVIVVVFFSFGVMCIYFGS